jgi:phosphoribosylformylglycinamidine synthase
MKAAVLTFPGSNCDRDLAVALEREGFEVARVWHKQEALPRGTDLVALPGGFSYGDYLRCGAIAARSPIVAALAAHVRRGGYAIGICNGFQILTESGLLPGVLMRNAGLRFICRTVPLRVATGDSVFAGGLERGAVIRLPVAHHDGNYVIDEAGLAQLTDEDRIAFTYVDNPNGSLADIAGVLSRNRRVLGMMPHPERASEAAQGSTEGRAVLGGILHAVVSA